LTKLSHQGLEHLEHAGLAINGYELDERRNDCVY
jgi:hypothetical protein